MLKQYFALGRHLVKRSSILDICNNKLSFARAWYVAWGHIILAGDFKCLNIPPTKICPLICNRIFMKVPARHDNRYLYPDYKDIFNNDGDGRRRLQIFGNEWCSGRPGRSSLTNLQILAPGLVSLNRATVVISFWPGPVSRYHGCGRFIFQH